MCLNAFGQRIFLSHSAFECSDVYYSDNCYSCHNIFACAGLRNAEYCILNKQYAKEEYEALLPKLVAHMKSTSEWGQFFPREISPFAYNESIVNEYYPLTKEQALTAGYRWEDDIPMTVGSPTKTYADLPKDPAQYSPDLVKETLACKRCKRNYRLTPQEIDFYKKMKLDLPAECFNCRHQQRMDSRNRRELWPGKCAQCEVEFMTSYSPDQHKQYKIFCETCYLKTI
jgi:hypothetical protein